MKELTHDAIEDLYRSESRRLVRALRHRYAQGEAEDLAQEGFLRLLRYCKGRVVTNAKALLYTAAFNLARNRRWRPFAFASLDSVGADTIPDWRNHAQEVEARDELRHIAAILATLPLLTRSVFVLHRIDELSYAAIAEQLNVTIATVRYHLTKAIVRLAEDQRETDVSI